MSCLKWRRIRLNCTVTSPRLPYCVLIAKWDSPVNSWSAPTVRCIKLSKPSMPVFMCANRMTLPNTCISILSSIKFTISKPSTTPMRKTLTICDVTLIRLWRRHWAWIPRRLILPPPPTLSNKLGFVELASVSLCYFN